MGLSRPRGGLSRSASWYGPSRILRGPGVDRIGVPVNFSECGVARMRAESGATVAHRTGILELWGGSGNDGGHGVVWPDHRSGRAFAKKSGKVMTAEKTTMAFGWRVYGLGVMALGMVCLAWGDFDLGQPVPKDFPDRTALAYAD